MLSAGKVSASAPPACVILHTASTRLSAALRCAAIAMRLAAARFSGVWRVDFGTPLVPERVRVKPFFNR